MTSCPRGHSSSEPDYCSVCGARLDLGTARDVTCPDCATPRAGDNARFCAICRFDFIERRPGPPPVARAKAPAQRRYALVVSVDPSLDVDPDPAHPCPVGEPAIVLVIDKPDLLVGRHDDTRAIHPEIPLRDPGVSRRHARFVMEPDGTLALQDLASTNGTQVNGRDVMPGTRLTLREGDRVTLGRWTKITLESRG